MVKVQGLWILALILVCALGVSCARADQGSDEPLIKWVPAGAQVMAPPAPAKQEPAPEAIPCPLAPVPDNGDIVRAIEKVAESCASRPAAWPTAAPEPQPQPQEIKESRPPAGPQVIDEMVSMLSGMTASWLGFQLNDLVLGKIWDNGLNQQRGELLAAQKYFQYLSAAARPKSADPLARVRASLLSDDLAKWWFPSGEKTLVQAEQALWDTSAAMKSGAVTVPGDPATARGLLLLASIMLAEEANNLSGDGDKDADDVFYHARGVALASSSVISGCLSSFDVALKDRQAERDVKLVVALLSLAADMDPLIVLSGQPDDLTSNHLLIMAYFLDRARESLDRAAEKLD
jgi:hypothetical protein